MNANRASKILSTLVMVTIFVTLALSIPSDKPAQAIEVPWTTSGNLSIDRKDHTLSLLPDGRVLAVGGRKGGYDGIAECEIYDPLTGTWRATASLANGRLYHTATVLPSGGVLVIGGTNGTVYFNSVEYFDPATETWTMTGSLNTARGYHTATVLPDDRVLVVGGFNNALNPRYPTNAEIFDPETETWSNAGVISPGRSNLTATLLPNGKVLVAGGSNSDEWDYYKNSYLFDLALSSFTATGNMIAERARHSATLLYNGKVLVVGGENLTGLTNSLTSYHLNKPGKIEIPNTSKYGPNRINDFQLTSLKTAELYNPAAGTWSSTGSMTDMRDGFAATLLPNGKVLVAGGHVNLSNPIIYHTSTELYNPASGTWSAGGNMNAAREDHASMLLPNGKVLVAGGWNVAGGGFNPITIASSELYAPPAGAWSPTGALSSARGNLTLTHLTDGKVLAAGGYDGTNSLTTTQIYNPAAGTWSNTGNLNTARRDHTATLLDRRAVLVTGGIGAGFSGLNSSEMYNPATGTWSSTPGTMNAYRSRHTATLLAHDSKVLVTGGVNGSTYLNTAEVFYPSDGQWHAIAPMTSKRANHTATLLPNGKVLVVGGYDGSTYLASAEIYNPETQSWSAAASLNSGIGRDYHTATLLPNDKVLIAGGRNAGGTISNSQVYDPATNTWSTTANLLIGRYWHTATLMSDGMVLVVGGWNVNDLNSVEIFDPLKASWSAAGNLLTGRSTHKAIWLGDTVLVAGGRTNSSTYINSAEWFDRWSSASDWRPQIDLAASPNTGNTPVYLLGNRFQGISEAYAGNNQGSAANMPMVQIRRVDNDLVRWLPPDGDMDTTHYDSIEVDFQAGAAAVTVTSNAIPSHYKFVNQIPRREHEIPDQYGTVGVLFNYSFPENTFRDPDGDSLTYTTRLCDDSDLPAWLIFTSAARNFSGTPTAKVNYCIRVIATDPLGAYCDDDFLLILERYTFLPLVYKP